MSTEPNYQISPLSCDINNLCHPVIQTFTEIRIVPFTCPYYLMILLSLVSLVWILALRGSATIFIFKHLCQEESEKTIYKSSLNLKKFITNSSTIEQSDSEYNDENKFFSGSLIENTNQNLLQRVENQLKLNSITEIQGYRDSLFGTICYLLSLLTSLLWLVQLLIILVDFYHNCELTGIDNFCFYGDYFIFGNFEINALVFFSVWTASSIWFGAWLFFHKNVIRNWFRIPCAAIDAKVIVIWSKKNESSWISFSTDIETHNIYFQHLHETLIKYFIYKGMRYIIRKNGYERPSIHVGDTYEDFHLEKNGLTERNVQEELNYIGSNQIYYKHYSLFEIILTEFFTWFYFYQWVMYTIWFWFSYLFVAAAETCIVLSSAFANIYMTWKNQRALIKLTEYHSNIDVLRNNEWQSIFSEFLVPGDVIEIKKDWKVPCDVILIEGSVICDESSINGESIPVQKISCPNENKIYDVKKSKGIYTLYSGTLVLEVKSKTKEKRVIGLVLKTGINTSTGDMVSSMFYPSKLTFKYDEELKIVVIILLLYGLVAFVTSLFLQARSEIKSNWVVKWAYATFTISQILTPLLPVALKVGQIRSCRRLIQKGILTVDASRIAICGKIKCFCFDKTGTLTKEGLQFLGIQEVKDMNEVNINLALLQKTKNIIILRGLASCHSLSFYNNNLVGNEVDLQMFKSTEWSVLEQYNSSTVKSSELGEELLILRRFEFDHELQTMSVIVKDKDEILHVYCKGSFEKIKSRCNPNTIPPNYSQIGDTHSLNGGYTLSLSHKILNNTQVNDIERHEIEKNLDFLGFLIFGNELKSDTEKALSQLEMGDVANVIITGDNANCAQYVARKSNLIKNYQEIVMGEIQDDDVVWRYFGKKQSEMINTRDLLSQKSTSDLFFSKEVKLVYAISGNETLEKLIQTKAINNLIFNIKIYARMSPDSKTKIINLLKKNGVIVGMCGDGGNDCGALKAAHAGIALSDTEASIVSPFTSKSKSCISAVHLVQEGRAALHTSFGVYKFLICYGQLFSIIKICSFYYGVLISLMGYIFIDVVAVLSLGFTMTLADPKKSLKKKRPTSSLLSMKTLASVLGVIFINFITFITIMVLVTNSKGYLKWPTSYADTKYWWFMSDNWESTGLYFSIYFNFISTALIFSFGSDFRSFVLKNVFLVCNWLILFLMTLFLLILPPNAYTRLWHIATQRFDDPSYLNPIWEAYYNDYQELPMPMGFKIQVSILAVILISFLLLCAWQSLFAEGPLGDKLIKIFKK